MAANPYVYSPNQPRSYILYGTIKTAKTKSFFYSLHACIVKELNLRCAILALYNRQVGYITNSSCNQPVPSIRNMLEVAGHHNPCKERTHICRTVLTSGKLTKHNGICIGMYVHHAFMRHGSHRLRLCHPNHSARLRY